MKYQIFLIITLFMTNYSNAQSLKTNQTGVDAVNYYAVLPYVY